MTTITTRTNKTTELSYAEGDANLNLDVIAASSDPSIGLAANRSTYECTLTFNFTLPLASSMISPTPGSTAKCNDYRVTIKNAGTGTITVKTTSPDTLDGVVFSGDQAVLPNEAFEYQVNAGKDGWISTSKVSASALSAAAVITTDALVKGSDGTRSVKESGIIVDASNNTSGVGTLGCGNITSTGTISGTTITASASFSGPGTNLSGTAAGLTAGSATTAAAVTNGGALNTPGSGTLTNCTGLPIVGGTTGTLSVARGGTGTTSATGLRYLDTIPTTSGTSAENTAIPAGVNQIQLNFQAVSTDGISSESVYLTVGSSGGYAGTANGTTMRIGTGVMPVLHIDVGGGIAVGTAMTAGGQINGTITLNKKDSSTNLWYVGGNLNDAGVLLNAIAGRWADLTTEITSIKVFTASDVFDGGSIEIWVTG